jgi:hypothetical protein
MQIEPQPPKQPYQKPQLEQHPEWTQSTGVSLPIGTRLIPESFEIPELTLGEQ